MPDHNRPPGDFNALLEVLRLGPVEIFENDPDGVIVLSPDLSIAYVNQVIVEIFGYSPQQLLGHAIEKLVPERFRGQHVGWRDGFLRHPRSRHMAKRLIQGLHADGSEMPLYVALWPVNSALGPIPFARVRRESFVDVPEVGG